MHHDGVILKLKDLFSHFIIPETLGGGLKRVGCFMCLWDGMTHEGSLLR